MPSICLSSGDRKSVLDLYRRSVAPEVRFRVHILLRLDARVPLANHLIRTVMAQAALTHGAGPRSISFKGAVQTLETFQPALALAGRPDAAARAAR